MPTPPSVAHLIGTDLDVDLDGQVRTLEVLDWADLLRQSEALAARAHGVPREQANELYNTHRDPANEIYNYFLDDEQWDRVTTGRWWPFGVLGIGYRAERYEEVDNDGLLAFDLTRADGGRVPVLWIRDGEVAEVAERLADLNLTVGGP